MFNNISYVLKFFKMLYHIVCLVTSLLKFTAKLFWLCCLLTSASIPWITFTILAACIGSRFCRLPHHNKKRISYLLESVGDGKSLHWPIANKGAFYDAPENSVAALNNCKYLKCRNVLLDLTISACGELVIMHKTTLEKVNISNEVSSLDLKSLESFNICEQHPLGSQFVAENILTFDQLTNILGNYDFNIFLLISNTSNNVINVLHQKLKDNPKIMDRIVICSKSFISLYKLRKQLPSLMAGFWIDERRSTDKRKIFLRASFIYSIYEVILRNLIAPVIGIDVVFVHKNEFSVQSSILWKNMGIHPIVYSVNSPNEKRYYQKVLQSHYLTESLRSEPEMFIKCN